MTRAPGTRKERAVVARILRSLRENAGISPSDLAHKLGWSTSSVAALEEGRRVPDILELRAVCQACGASLEEAVSQIEDELQA
jgi:transcriptional regulator with XRE-family HTH domain